MSDKKPRNGQPTAPGRRRAVGRPKRVTGARRIQDLLIERADGELLAIRTSTGEAHALNETAAIVFDMCDGSTSRTAMAAEVRRRTGLPADDRVIDLALQELAEAGLVVRPRMARTRPITRRSLIRRLAIPAVMTALLPVVETVLLPTPASAQPPGQQPPGQQGKPGNKGRHGKDDDGPSPTPTGGPTPVPSPTPPPPSTVSSPPGPSPSPPPGPSPT